MTARDWQRKILKDSLKNASCANCAYLESFPAYNNTTVADTLYMHSCRPFAAEHMRDDFFDQILEVRKCMKTYNPDDYCPLWKQR